MAHQSTVSSFKVAFRGIWTALRESGHLKFHFFAAAVVISAGFYLQISSFEWLILVLTSAAVISAEIINTCAENIEDILRDQVHVPYEYTGKAKDMAAGAVLVFAIASVLIAVVIFLPKILLLL
jgi:diacylglycerol kinase